MQRFHVSVKQRSTLQPTLDPPSTLSQFACNNRTFMKIMRGRRAECRRDSRYFFSHANLSIRVAILPRPKDFSIVNPSQSQIADVYS